MNKYKFALSCLKTNKLKDAERVLLGNELAKPTKNLSSIPNGSYGLYLMGVIAEKQQRYNDAKEYFLKALELNPTLWSAYEKIGKLGENIMPNRIFNESKLQTIKPATGQRKRKEEEPENNQRIKRTPHPITNVSHLNKKRSNSSTHQVTSINNKI